MKIQKNQVGLKLNGTHQLLDYVLGESSGKEHRYDKEKHKNLK
jgi:hypothetical protein